MSENSDNTMIVRCEEVESLAILYVYDELDAPARAALQAHTHETSELIGARMPQVNPVTADRRPHGNAGVFAQRRTVAPAPFMPGID